MYNELTHECKCNRCGHSWRSRGETKPAVCAKCTSKLWDNGTRKLDYIIARAYGREENGERLKFCILDYIDKPGIETEDIFYMKKEDTDKYLLNRRFPGGSGMVFIGSFEIGEDQELKVHEMKLIYCHEVGFREYLSVNCLFNIRSFYERQKEAKRREEEEARKAALEGQRKQELLEAARKKIEEEAQRLAALEAAKRTIISDEGATTEEKLRAVALLEQHV